MNLFVFLYLGLFHSKVSLFSSETHPVRTRIGRSRTAFAVLALSILLNSHASAQAPAKEARFRRLAENTRLSNLNITTIAQDSRGFLWVGTLDGLNRFDGYDFKIYRNVDNDTTSIVANRIQSLFEDSRGTLWVSSLNSGLQYFDPQLDIFRRIPEFSQRYCQVFRITEDDQHNIWIGGAYNGQAFVATQNHQTGRWEKFLLFRAAEGIYSILQISENEFWLGSQSNGLFKWNRNTKALEQTLHDPAKPDGLPGNFLSEIVRDRRGNLWIGTHDGGLSKFNVKDNKFTNYTADSKKFKTTIPNNTIRSMCSDGRQLWIATENGGLSLMDMDTEELTNYLYDKSNPNSIINNSIWSVHKDKQGRIWAGSFAKGLCVLDGTEDKLPIYDHALESDLINAIFIDSKDRMWVGTEDGLVLKDRTGSHRFRYEVGNPRSLSSNAINCVYEDRKHRIWIGVWDGGINRFVEESRSFIRYNHDANRKESMTDPNVFNIAESSKTGELLVSTFGGMNVLTDEQKGTFENKFKYLHEGDQLHFTLLEDSHHNIWVGTRNGLHLYDLETLKITPVNLGTDTTQTIDQVNCLFESRDGTLWIGSSGGLHEMSSRDKIKTYTIRDGLPVNFVQGILEDSKGNLWLGTTRGLAIFNRTTKTFKTLDESDGLLSNELRRKSFFTNQKTGQMYVGGKGINTFFPDSIFVNPNKPSVYITDLKIFNQSVVPNGSDGILTNDISQTKEIYLDDPHNYFTLYYVGINFTHSYKNQYAYKLEGFEDKWVSVGTQRFATFTNLDPGQYTFRVKASNNDGLWNDVGTSLIIHVLPPWWKTWWARTLFFIAVVGIAMLIFALRTKRILRANIALERAVNQKTRELQQTNLALLKSQEEIRIKNQTLTAQSEELAAQNEELIQSQEEVSAQRDLVEEKNQTLFERQKIIEQQNENLELEVSKRTRELVEYNQQLEQFAFVAAHNLRAPVARILGLGQLLDLGTAEEKEEIYPKVVFTARELDEVVKDLNTILEFRSNLESHITEVDLATEVAKITRTLERDITSTQAVVATDFSQAPNIRTVKPYLESILYNLISNALKYRHPERIANISVSTQKLENEICLRVVDNGLGIDLTAHRDKLFTLYSRFHVHLDGKGLGLYLVKTQITALGGRIEIDSKVDQGSEFRVYFKN